MDNEIQHSPVDVSLTRQSCTSEMMHSLFNAEPLPPMPFSNTLQKRNILWGIGVSPLNQTIKLGKKPQE